MALLRLRSVCTFVLLLAWLSPGSFAVKANEPRAAFSVELSNPVTPDEPPKRYKVFATTDPDGTPTGYNVRLQVHVCMDNQCRIVHLTMYWDALGYYQRIECPMNAPLTRMEHEVFTDADYRKLDRILKNRQSLLATLPYEALVVKQSEPAEGIDGWSGATPQAVADAVVEGAAFTTWVLWHYANGEIVPRLRTATCKRATPAYVRRLLQSEDPREADFALRYVLAQSPADNQYIDDALDVLGNTRQIEHVSLALDYVCRAATDQQKLHKRLVELARGMDGYTSRPILDYFTEQPELPAETREVLSAALEDMPYFAVHRILEMLAKNKQPAKVEANIVQLLDHDNFFIARRAYEYLQGQKNDNGVQEKLTAFRKQFGDRL